MCAVFRPTTSENAFIQSLAIKPSKTRQELLDSLKRCVDDFQILFAEIETNDEPQSDTQESTEGFRDLWTKMNNVYDALVSCSCDLNGNRELYETRLHSTTKFEHWELCNCCALDLLITHADCQSPDEVRFLVVEKRRLVSSVTVRVSFSQWHTNSRMQIQPSSQI